MQPNTGFLSLAEELQFYILRFLPYRDILRCTSVCKALHQTYLSSSELQYIVELGGQQLIPIPNTDNYTTISERLQLLRNKAHAFFKVDIHSYKTVSIPEYYRGHDKFLADGHIWFWEKDDDSALIVPLFPKPPQQTIQRDWSPGTLCSIPDSANLDVFMDPAQNLIAVVYIIGDFVFDETTSTYIDLRALDVDGTHPHAAGPTLLVSEMPGCDNIDWDCVRLKGFGSYIALLRASSDQEMWQLHIWDWKRSTKSTIVLGNNCPYAIDFCFLGDNRWLVVADDLKLYSAEDMSQTPELLACFVLPAELPGIMTCILPVDDSARSSQPQMQVQQTMYTSDPKNRLLCIAMSEHSSIVYIISTRIFFDLDEMAGAMPIPWKCWGPSNTRIFRYPFWGQFPIHLSRNRVLLFSDEPGYQLHIMDFSPLAVTNRRGLGRVVREPSTLDVTDPKFICHGSEECLTTFLPYIEVVLDINCLLRDVWIDKDRIYLLSDVLQVIDI